MALKFAKNVVKIIMINSGEKYLRKIMPVNQDAANALETAGVVPKVDVYAVLVAFNVTCPARQHAIKKLLCSGLRGKGDVMQDLTEARDAITRAIEIEGCKK